MLLVAFSWKWRMIRNIGFQCVWCCLLDFIDLIHDFHCAEARHCTSELHQCLSISLCRPTTISRTFQSLLWLQIVIITGTESALKQLPSHRAFYGPLYYTCNFLRAILSALAVYTFRSFLLQRMRKPFAIEYREYLFNVLRTQPRAFVEGIFEVP